jgi:hypothetical protein
MVSLPSTGVFTATALGAVVGCLGYYMSKASHERDTYPVLISTLMGGVGYCIGVLTKSRAPEVVAITLAVTTLLAIFSSGFRRNDVFLNSASLGIPMATGATFLATNNFLHPYSAASFAITVIVVNLIDRNWGRF